MEFSVEPDVFACLPGMRLAVVVAHDVDNRADRPAVAEAWARAWAAAATAVAPYGNVQSHPRVRAWRERFRPTGVSMRQFPTSIEALLRQLMWRQACDGLIHRETRAAFLVSESLPEAGAGLAETVLDELGGSAGTSGRRSVASSSTPPRQASAGDDR